MQGAKLKEQSIKLNVPPSETLVNPLAPAGPSHKAYSSPPLMVTVLPKETTILSATGANVLLSRSNIN